MRQASVRVVDSLPEVGGQCTTLYPEKWIFDVPGHPKVLARELVERLVEQIRPFAVPVELDTTVTSIAWDGDVVTLRSEEHTSELQSRQYLVCRLLLEKKKKKE